MTKKIKRESFMTGLSKENRDLIFMVGMEIARFQEREMKYIIKGMERVKADKIIYTKEAIYDPPNPLKLYRH